ncbi:MAG: hypothetical protein CM15mP62_00990 [Rhodospirillaceae bacterium]|nr:MAG: hypothetical protein CM15mP62_00990 [Rhodospirillaceae bacterium]
MTLGLSTKNSKNWNFIALGLVLSLVGVLFFWEKLSADDDLKNQCKKTLEKARLWVRATDAKAPEEEKVRVKKAVDVARTRALLLTKLYPMMEPPH